MILFYPMISSVSRDILNVHDFGEKNMRTGVIPFGSSQGYGLTQNQKSRLHSKFAKTTTTGNIDAKRLVAMADRAKAMLVRLYEDVANFAQNRSEKDNLIHALDSGISFGKKRGLHIVNSMFRNEAGKPSVTNPIRQNLQASTPALV